MIHCAADLRIRQLGNFTSTILRKTRAALTSGERAGCGVRVHDGARQPDHYIYRSEDGPARR